MKKIQLFLIRLDNRLKGDFLYMDYFVELNI